MKVRALTLWRPWDLAIVYGPKRVENRPRRWNIKGYLLAIHSGKRWDAEGAKFITEFWDGACVMGSRWRESTGSIIGAALVGQVRPRLSEPWDSDFYPWEFGPWCYVLRDVVAFDEPIGPMRGKQGLWKLSPDVELEVAGLWTASRLGAASS